MGLACAFIINPYQTTFYWIEILYLIPFTVIPVALLALYQGEFKDFWNGTLKHDENSSETDQSAEGSLNSDDNSDGDRQALILTQY